MGRRSDGGRDGGRAGAAGRLRDLLPLAVVALLTLGVLAGLAVLPARTWLSQRRDIAEAESELRRAEAEVDDLTAELEELQSDDAVERLAREHFDLVFPGEESYRIVEP